MTLASDDRLEMRYAVDCGAVGMKPRNVGWATLVTGDGSRPFQPTWNPLTDDGDALRLAVFREGSQKAFAAKHGINEIVLSDMIRGRRVVSARIANMVGVDRITIYRCQTAKEPQL